MRGPRALPSKTGVRRYCGPPTTPPGGRPVTGPQIQSAEAVIDNRRFGTRTIRFETGQLARQAAGAAVAYLDEETMVLSATTVSRQPKEHLDFFPLTIDVEERMYAAGRIPGSFFR